MIVRIILFVFLLTWLSACGPRKEYIERNGLHSDQKPNEIAKEIGKVRKSQTRIYERQEKKLKRALKKRNRKRLKGNYYE